MAESYGDLYRVFINNVMTKGNAWRGTAEAKAMRDRLEELGNKNRNQGDKLNIRAAHAGVDPSVLTRPGAIQTYDTSRGVNSFTSRSDIQQDPSRYAQWNNPNAPIPTAITNPPTPINPPQGRVSNTMMDSPRNPYSNFEEYLQARQGGAASPTPLNNQGTKAFIEALRNIQKSQLAMSKLNNQFMENMMRVPMTSKPSTGVSNTMMPGPRNPYATIEEYLQARQGGVVNQVRTGNNKQSFLAQLIRQRMSQGG